MSATMQNAYTNTLESGLDWSPEMTLEQFEQLTRNYQTYSQVEQFEDQVPDPPPPQRGAAQMQFTSINFDSRPDVVKRYRLHMETLLTGADLESPLSTTYPVFTFLWGHYYILRGYPEGIVADMLAARARGARKDEVAHLLALAWFHGGNIGMNATARLADRWMRAWDPNDGAPGLVWPNGWKSDPTCFQCGIDFTRPPEGSPLSAAELETIADWYREWQGDVPAFVSFLGRHFPTALRTFRARYETAMDGPLPAQLIVLIQLHLAALTKSPDALRRTVHMARKLGLGKDAVVQVVAFAQLYLSDTEMDATIRDTQDVFDNWD